MFDLEKELDEIRLDYYIRNKTQNNSIEISLADICKLLSVSKGKAQKLIEKFLTLGILEIENKGNSRTNKTRYKYKDNSIVIDTDKVSNTNKYKDLENTDKYTDVQKIIELYKEQFELTAMIRKEINICCNDIDLELFNYLLKQILNNSSIKIKDRYLIKTLKDLNNNNIKTVEEFIKYTDNYKSKKQNQKDKKNWNYTENNQEDVDLEMLARMTRFK